jgi:acetyltransferase-like isoleucine patch superfamily enzyme
MKLADATLADVFEQIEFRAHYILWCIRFPRLFSHRFNIGSGSRLNIGPKAQLLFAPRVCFRRNFTGDFFGKVTMGYRVHFQPNCHVSVREELTIGDYSIFGEGVSIHDEMHIATRGSDPISDRGFITKPISIGRNVWVGAKVTILSGVHIGDNAVIGANAVVTHDVPAYTVVGGVPARVIRTIQPLDEPKDDKPKDDECREIIHDSNFYEIGGKFY